MPYTVIISRCRQSRLCIVECPMDAISFDDTKNVAVIDPELCTDCGSCADVCPEAAITGMTED